MEVPRYQSANISRSSFMVSTLNTSYNPLIYQRCNITYKDYTIYRLLLLCVRVFCENLCPRINSVLFGSIRVRVRARARVCGSLECYSRVILCTHYLFLPFGAWHQISSWKVKRGGHATPIVGVNRVFYQANWKHHPTTREAPYPGGIP